MNPQSQINTDELLKLTRAFFDEFCEEHEVAVANRHKVAITEFYEWFQDKAICYTADSLAETHSVTREAAAYVLWLGTDPQGMGRFPAFWPHMILSRRPCRNPVRSFALMLALTWQDGVTGLLTQMAHVDASSSPINDADVVQMTITQAPELGNKVIANSLDELHQHFLPNCQGMFDPETFDMIDQMLSNSTVQPDAVMAKRIKAMLSTMRTLFPLNVSKAVQEVHQRRPVAVPPPQQRGGFAG